MPPRSGVKKHKDGSKKAAQKSLRGYALVLGAGASHGARVGEASPPLDVAFLRTAQKVLGGRGRKPKADSKAWSAFVHALKQTEIKPKTAINGGLEALATYLEARANMPSLQSSRGRPAKYSNALTALGAVICHTLRKTNGAKECSLHKALIELVQPSCIVTFNYDLIADTTLMSLGKLAWSRKEYAASKTVFVPGKRMRLSPRQKPRGKRWRGAIPLLKLHGSMNWESPQRGGGFSLVLDRIPSDSSLPCSVCPKRALVVPPVASKTQIRETGLLSLWNRATRLLHDAKGWILWGYSFPRTDTITQVLLTTALAKNRKPKPVVVINPDPQAGVRVRTQLQKVSVRKWSSVERFLLDHGRLSLTSDSLRARRSRRRR